MGIMDVLILVCMLLALPARADDVGDLSDVGSGFEPLPPSPPPPGNCPLFLEDGPYPFTVDSSMGSFAGTLIVSESTHVVNSTHPSANVATHVSGVPITGSVSLTGHVRITSPSKAEVWIDMGAEEVPRHEDVSYAWAADCRQITLSSNIAVGVLFTTLTIRRIVVQVPLSPPAPPPATARSEGVDETAVYIAVPLTLLFGIPLLVALLIVVQRRREFKASLVESHMRANENAGHELGVLHDAEKNAIGV